MKEFRLSIELTPDSVWGVTLANILPRGKWDRIRKHIYNEYDHKCGVCGLGDSLEAHEIWAFDDKEHILKLTGFTTLCYTCHKVKHIDHWERVDLVEFDNLAEYFCKVNECNTVDFLAYYKKERLLQDVRSQYKWAVHFGEYEHVVKEVEESTGISRYNYAHYLRGEPKGEGIYNELDRCLEETHGKPDPAILEKISKLFKSGNITETDDIWTYIYACEKCGHKWTHTLTDD